MGLVSYIRNIKDAGHEGADYSLESLVRKFVKAPVVAYKPKKGGETDPAIAPVLERGMRYIGEFASPEDPVREE